MDENIFLEKKLRAVRPDAVPGDLLGKLLADIPSGIRPAARWAPVSGVWWLAGAAVLMAAASVTINHWPPTRSPERAVSMQFVIYRSQNNQETDPCAIFPPFADSRRF